jgi:zinc transport system substrate-binding protein
MFNLALLCVFTTPAFASSEKPIIVSSILPIHLIVQEIAGQNATTRLLFEQRVPVHHVTLTPAHISSIRQADHVFIAHRNLEHYLISPLNVHATDRYSIAAEHANTLVDLTDSLPNGHEPVKYSDPHIWLHPENAISFARHVRETLSELAPEYSEKFEARYKKFAKEIRIFNDELQSEFAGSTKPDYAILHNSLRYFERAYGIDSLVVLSSHDTHRLRAEEVAKILEYGETLDCVFIEPGMEESPTRDFIANQGIKIVIADPLGYSYHPQNYKAFLKATAKVFTDCLISVK